MLRAVKLRKERRAKRRGATTGQVVPAKPEKTQDPKRPRPPDRPDEQRRFAKRTGLAVQRDLDLGGGVKLPLALIPPGEVTPAGAADPIRVARPFYMATHEVTQAEYDAITSPVIRIARAGNLPVRNVSWRDAAMFCEEASKKTGAHVRLPTPAEWEYACRAGAPTRDCFGDDLLDLPDYAWYAPNAWGQAHPVAAKRLNAWGLYDVHGNVSEWCTATKRTRGKEVACGGSWKQNADLSHAADRFWLPENAGNDLVGFRIVVDLKRRPE